MVAMSRIEEFGRRIGREFGAEKVILFGSHARGTPASDSDVDLLVIGPFSGHGVDTSVAVQMKLRPGFPVDLLVRTPEKVRERIAMGDTFMQEILSQGIILYEANDR
jgi:predicted nucleotidyltransferase